MSIQDQIKAHVNREDLYLLSPSMPGSRIIRHMYASPEIKVLLDGPWDALESEVRCSQLRADLEVFVTGGIIPVAKNPFKEGRTAYLKRLDPQREEVWEIRSRDPAPQIRVFGRFAKRDMFLALGWALRSDLGGPEDPRWNQAINECKAEWRRLLPAYPPLTADPPDDFDQYVSKNFPV